MSSTCSNITQPVTSNEQQVSMEEYLRAKAKLEDQIDYNFIQRIIQEVTKSCALPLPIPADAIPPIVLQAFDYFIENFDGAVEERYFCVKRSEFQRCGTNFTVKLPPQIVSVFGVYKITDSFNYGVMGDFSLERMILNQTNMASGMGGSITNTFNSGYGYNLTDLVASLYEISTFKTVFQAPLTYNYNAYSNDLVILGDLGNSDLVLQVFKRCKLQDLYKLFYFFRYCVCLVKESLATIYGSIEFKLPGGVQINYQRFQDAAEREMDKIDDWIAKNRAADYFLNNNTI